MSRIRMAVEVRNETGSTLQLAGSDLSSGDWTDPWRPPGTIGAQATGEFRAEGDAVLGAPTTGTEGHVRYNIDGDAGRQLMIHFNSPLVEVGSSRVDLQACKLEYSIVSPK